MKRLKRKCPFAGYGGFAVFISILFYMLSVTIFTSSNQILTLKELVFCSSIVPVLLVIMHYLLRRETNADKKIMSSAKAVVWKKCGKYERKKAVESISCYYAEFITVFIILVITLIVYSMKIKNSLFIAIFCGTIGVLVLIFVGLNIRKMLWKKIDSSARYTILPITSTYAVSGLKSTNHYAVIHTNEDKLILKMNSLKEMKAKQVCIIEYNNMVTYTFI